VKERPVEHDTIIPKSGRAIVVGDEEASDENPHSNTSVNPGRLALSHAEKAEALDAQS
jgi:hypothetical protein